MAKKDSEEKIEEQITQSVEKIEDDESDETIVGEKVVSLEYISQLEEELEEIKHQSEENSEGWQRERADFANYKKRIQRDAVLQRRNMSGDLIKKFLPIMDDLERALKNRPNDNEGAAWADGMELVFKKFQTVLEAEGVTRIEAENLEFDPNLHEAITHEESPDHESGQIIEVIQQGYLIDERVLRPAMVRVAK